jgi:ribosome recycling factor
MTNAIIDTLKRRMQGALDVLSKEFSGLRTGRAHSSILDGVKVDAYGSLSPLTQVGTVSAPEPRMLTVQVWDRGLVKSVEKAILESGLGLNPLTEGQIIRIPMPELSEDRRRELAKVASKYAEAARVSVRNVRRDGMDAFKKAEKESEISKDDHHRLGQEVQALTDEFIKKIDDHLASKEKDIMHV